MSCVTCDGAGEIDPPDYSPNVLSHGWILTGTHPTQCPVCRGPHVRGMVTEADARGCEIECGFGDCDEVIDMGFVVYSQLHTTIPPKLDEAIFLCCDDHGDQMAADLREGGHPTVCLPFCIDDARE